MVALAIDLKPCGLILNFKISMVLLFFASYHITMIWKSHFEITRHDEEMNSA